MAADSSDMTSDSPISLTVVSVWSAPFACADAATVDTTQVYQSMLYLTMERRVSMSDSPLVQMCVLLQLRFLARSIPIGCAYNAFYLTAQFN